MSTTTAVTATGKLLALRHAATQLLAMINQIDDITATCHGFVSSPAQGSIANTRSDLLGSLAEVLVQLGVVAEEI